MTTRASVTRRAILVSATVLAFAACGSDDDETGGPATSVSTTAGASTTTTVPGVQMQPAVWPAPDVTFDTPEAAAVDFVRSVIGVPPELGEFQAGDARSGEIEVLSPGEGADPQPLVRSRLLLRQLGPRDGWFVIGAVNENVSITTPTSGAEVAGPVTVEGVGRGFEGTIVVRAIVPGGTALDEAITQGGSRETPQPYRVELDISDAVPGDVIGLLARGGTGLETDPGEFSAIPVVVSE